MYLETEKEEARYQTGPRNTINRQKLYKYLNIRLQKYGLKNKRQWTAAVCIVI